MRHPAEESAEQNDKGRESIIPTDAPGIGRDLRVSIAFAFVFALLSAMLIYMVISVRWLPFLDFGSHVQLFDIVQRLESPDTVYREVYEVLLIPAPNVLTLWLAKWVAPLVDARIYAKCLFAIGLVGLPASLCWFARETGRTPWLGLIGFALCLNKQLVDGFVNWVIGLPLMFVTFALLARYLRTVRTVDGIVLSLTMVLLFFVHGLAWLFAITVTSVWLLLSARRWRDVFATILIPLPAALVALPSVFVDKAPPSGIWEMRPLVDRVRFLGQSSIDIFHDPTSQWVFFAVISFAALLFVFAILFFRDRLRFDLPLFVLVCAAATYFFAPLHVPQFYVLSDRFAVPMLAVLVVFAGVSVGREKFAIGPAALMTISLATCVYYGHAMEVIRANYEAHTLPKERLVEQVRDRSWLGTYVDNWSETLRIRQQHETVGMHAILNGGPHADGFQRAMTSVVRFQPNQMPPWSNLSPISTDELRSLDYMIIESAHTPRAANRANVEVVDRVGNYWLLENRRSPGCRYDTCAGGFGGSSRAAECDDGGAVSGVRVLVNEQRAVSLAVRCDDSGRFHEWEIDDDMVAPTDRTPSNQVLLECEGSDRFVGIAGFLNDTARGVSGVRGICEPSNGRADYMTAVAGHLNVGAFELRCDKGSSLHGIEGRSGRWMDRVSIECSFSRPTTGTADNAEFVPQ